MLTGKAVAQSVTVDATIDSLQIYIGDQAKIKLQVALDADKRAIFPVYTDTLVSGVEIIDVAKPDTQYINDDKRMLITQEYTVTSLTRHCIICHRWKYWWIIRHIVRRH